MTKPKKETQTDKKPPESKLVFSRPTDPEFCAECARRGRLIAKLKVKRDRSKGVSLGDLKAYNEEVAGLVEYSTTRGDPKLADKFKFTDQDDD